jgi:hypothetical protein
LTVCLVSKPAEDYYQADSAFLRLLFNLSMFQQRQLRFSLENIHTQQAADAEAHLGVISSFTSSFLLKPSQFSSRSAFGTMASTTVDYPLYMGHTSEDEFGFSKGQHLLRWNDQGLMILFSIAAQVCYYFTPGKHLLED